MYRVFLIVGLMVGVLRGQEQTADHRLRTATTVLHEILSAPDKGIPEDILAKAQCVMIVPGLKKGAFIVGGEYGRGFALCRRNGMWGGPAAIKFGGGSFGAQIGGESTDVVMLVMNRRGGYGHPVARGDSVVLKDARNFCGGFVGWNGR